MNPHDKKSEAVKPRGNTRELFALAKPYSWSIIAIFALSIIVNVLGLVVPKIIASAVDTFAHTTFNTTYYTVLLLSIATGAFVFGTVQSICQAYVSERIARDLRSRLIARIAEQEFSFVNQVTPEKLLTNLTGDVDNIKDTISQGMVQIFSSVILIIGTVIFLISINWWLALIVLSIIPVIAMVFFFTLVRIRKFFIKRQQTIDKLNRTINESIVTAALVRILNSTKNEFKKFRTVSGEARNVGTTIVNLFSILIPMIGLIANASVVLILYFGGHAIVDGTFTIGQFSAFISYVWILLFPIIIIGFISGQFTQAAVSYGRIKEVLDATPKLVGGKLDRVIKGEIVFDNVSLTLSGKEVLKNISFTIPDHSKTAILGPTAAGKTQIFHLLAGLFTPTSGRILIDGTPLQDYTRESRSNQIGLVFQDSSLFNTSILENINFKNVENRSHVEKAIETAELKDFVDTLPQGIETVVAERGTSLSGGQKQRITLARALVLNPKVLLLDDFTARVDNDTERRIFANMKKNYEGITQVLITQQVASVVDFDNIILVMEGEILAQGTHAELLASSVEYDLIYKSQMSLT